jgi:hypothetical protein
MVEEIDRAESQAMIMVLGSTATNLINYETLEQVSSRKRHRLVMLGSAEIQERFFFMIKPEQVNDGVLTALHDWREVLNKDDERLAFMLKYMLPKIDVVLSLKRFVVSLIGFIDKVKSNPKNAFKEFEEFKKVTDTFVNDPELKLIEASFHKYIYGDFNLKAKTLIKLKTSLSPQKLINGFSSQNQIVIDPVEDFVFTCFQFHSNYQAKVGKGQFVFNARFKHSLTALLFQMKRKKWITDTNEEIIEFIVQLLPGSSRDSLRKYSSPSKKISSKHAIDIQLFS